MKIEKEKIRILPLDLAQIKQSGKLRGRNTKSDLALSALHIEMLELFNKTFSLYDVFQHFYKKRQSLSYEATLGFLVYLIEEGYILNESFRDYFIKQSAIENIFSKLTDKFSGEEPVKVVTKNEIKNLPFFRNLSAEAIELLLKHSRTVEVPAGVTLCNQGALQRSLLVLLSGQASVLKKNEKGVISKNYTLTESNVFGEVGFFFAEARSASVVTDTNCKVMVIQYIPEVYDDMIKFEKSRNLQLRIKMIQALSRSSIFKGLPQDCFDALIFAGVTKQIPADTYICKEGEAGETCYLIIEGQVEVHKGGKSVARLGAGDCFGEMALLVTRGRRTATVKSLTDMDVLEIPTPNFYSLLSENFMLGCEFEKMAIARLK